MVLLNLVMTSYHISINFKDSGASKKKKVKRWTAEDVYIDSKFESYKEEHPALDDDEVRSKLTRKFNKMSEEKKVGGLILLFEYSLQILHVDKMVWGRFIKRCD